MQKDLRTNAEDRINGGTAPVTRGSPLGTHALALLHRLASAPESASDALKLLHELQVHQVELDLQAEQAESDLRQLIEDQTNYTALFDLAPFAYLVLEPGGVVIATNRIAANWLAPGMGQGKDWTGRRIEDLLSPQCRGSVRNIFAALRNGEGSQTCAVQSINGGVSAHAVATATPGGEQVLMAFMA